MQSLLVYALGALLAVASLAVAWEYMRGGWAWGWAYAVASLGASAWVLLDPDAAAALPGAAVGWVASVV
ncbi:hypothetical protein [Streptomyces sp. NPDC058623]|uniref:hypothetical protein n=1 Tax=Streptomyces sp. NPDC058623 TaxID=3346563 RepID=UPI00364D9F05